MKFTKICFGLFLVLAVNIVGCKTKSDMRREQELARLQQDVTQVKTEHADIDSLSEEFKIELSKTNNLIEERAQTTKQSQDELRKEVLSLSSRMQALENRAIAEESQEKQKTTERATASFEKAKKLYDDGHFSDAAEMFRTLTQQKSKPEESKKSLYWLGESYFADKEYASAALEFSEYKKAYPKDGLVPQAIYRQANSFRQLGKAKEAKLFYQELIERFPKNALVKKAKVEMKKLK